MLLLTFFPSPQQLARECQRSCSSWRARSDPGTAAALAGTSGSEIEVGLEERRGRGAGAAHGDLAHGSQRRRKRPKDESRPEPEVQCD